MKAIRLYAQVLVDAANAPDSKFKLSDTISELSAFAQMAVESPMFLKVFDNPTLGDDEKQKVLKEFAAKVKASPLSERFLSILVKRNRMGILGEILNQAESIEIEKKGGLVGELVSAIPLEAQVVTNIQDALSKKLNKAVQLKQRIDTGIIAGMRVTISGVTYDGSVKGKLDQLAGSL